MRPGRALHVGERLATGFVHADQVDHPGRPGDDAPQRGFAAQIGALHDDLADAAERLQMLAMGVRAATDDQDARAAIGQTLDHIAPDEAGAPENREQAVAHRASGLADAGNYSAGFGAKTSSLRPGDTG